MKAANVLKLDDWVRNNKSEIQVERPSLKALGGRLTEALGFKVSAGSLRDILVANAVETRGKSKHQRQIEALQAELAQMHEILLKVVSAAKLPEWLRRELLVENLDDEVKTCLRRRTVEQPVEVGAA